MAIRVTQPSTSSAVPVAGNRLADTATAKMLSKKGSSRVSRNNFTRLTQSTVALRARAVKVFRVPAIVSARAEPMVSRSPLAKVTNAAAPASVATA